jgi:L-ascorbate metabolism protein UlaG (beta-lactamase superfamily)
MTESTKPVATVERDESRDVWVGFSSTNIPRPGGVFVTHTFPTHVLKHSNLLIKEADKHYVPFTDLQTETARRVALEERIDIQETVEFRLRAKLEEEQAQLRKQTETMLKLRAFAERVANTAYIDDMSCKAQDLLFEISR